MLHSCIPKSLSRPLLRWWFTLQIMPTIATSFPVHQNHKHTTLQAQTFATQTLAAVPVCTFPREPLSQSSIPPCPVLLFQFSSPLFGSTWHSYSTSRGSLDRSLPTRGRFEEILASYRAPASDDLKVRYCYSWSRKFYRYLWWPHKGKSQV